MHDTISTWHLFWHGITLTLIFGNHMLHATCNFPKAAVRLECLCRSLQPVEIIELSCAIVDCKAAAITDSFQVGCPCVTSQHSHICLGIVAKYGREEYCCGCDKQAAHAAFYLRGLQECPIYTCLRCRSPQPLLILVLLLQLQLLLRGP